MGRVRLRGMPPHFWLWTITILGAFSVIYWRVAEGHLDGRKAQVMSKQRAIVALVSDMQIEGKLSAIEKPLKVLARKHDLVVIEVEDPIESALPNVGLVSVKDPETGKASVIDTSDARVRKAYAEKTQAERQKVRATFQRLGVDRVTVTEDESSQALVRFLRSRAKKAA